MSDIQDIVVPGLHKVQEPTKRPEEIAAHARADQAVRAGDLQPVSNPSVLRSLRRVQLWEVARAHGITHDESCDDWLVLIKKIEAWSAETGTPVFPLPKVPPQVSRETAEPPEPEVKFGDTGFSRAKVKAMPFMLRKAIANELLVKQGLDKLPKDAKKDAVEAALRRYG